ncbi:MAG: DUF4340 domain-containing protein [Cellulosilyticum sp.]|nr:DUF4340 domain-containing protein [Cellulosilyticum sp.]
MKKTLTITLATLTLAGLLGLLWFTTSRNSKPAKIDSTTVTDTTQTGTSTPTETKPETSTETVRTPIVSLNSDEVSHIEVTVGSNTLSYTLGEENCSIKGYEDYALDQSGLNYRTNKLLNIEGIRTIKDANLAEYGLDAPSKKATYHLKDGSTITLSLGNLSLDHISVYAMLDSDSSTVYVIDSLVYNCMIGDIDTYRTKELESYNSANIYDITIGGSQFENIYLKLSAEQNGYTNSYDLVTDDIKNALANSYSVEQLKTALPVLAVSEFVADDVTDLSVYGLDQPILHLTMNYFDPTTATSMASPADFDIVGQVDYIWGNTLENGNIAFMKVGDTSVYSMDSSFLTTFKEYATPFYLVSKYVAMPNIKNVTAIDVTFDDATYHMTVDETNESYTLNNKDMEKSLFKKLYRNVASVSAEIKLEEASTNTTTVATITYTLADGTSKVATFVPSTNDQYYQTYLEDVLLVGVTKTQLNNLKETLKAAAAGEEFNDVY